MKSRIIMTLAAIGILALSSIAQAGTQTFNIASSFANLVGNTGDNFTWSLSTVAISPITLAVGGSQTFTYGKFFTDDFQISWDDAADNNDSFLAQLLILPPSTPPSSNETGNIDPDVTLFGFGNGQVAIDFNNTAHIVTFGTGGKYSVTFLDPDDLCADGYRDLQAKIELLTESTPVPEPGTMMLLGAGFLGLAVYGKRRKNA